MTRIDRTRIAQLAQRYDDSDPIVRDAREWLIDAFGHDEDAERYVEEMDVFLVILAIEIHFGGGWEHFIDTGRYQ